MAKSDDVVTKKYLTLSRVKSENKLINEIRNAEKRLRERDDSIERKVDDFRNDISEKYNNLMNMLDKIAGMLKKDDEERTILSYRVFNHEDRIKKLEKVQVAL